jgi:hypothetical protein
MGIREKCPKCNNQSDVSTATCEYCGTDLAEMNVEQRTTSDPVLATLPELQNTPEPNQASPQKWRFEGLDPLVKRRVLGYLKQRVVQQREKRERESLGPER